jgi:hypothetical protein
MSNLLPKRAKHFYLKTGAYAEPAKQKKIPSCASVFPCKLSTG